MIYTVTFSPSLDYIVYTPRMRLGEVNRAEQEFIYPGGKGINVSILLSRLGIESKAIAFLAGFTGEALKNMLQKDLHGAEYIYLPEGNTRINVKVKANEESELNGRGPSISADKMDELMQKLNRLKSGDVLVLAGNAPIASCSYGDIMKALQGKGILFVIDTTGEQLLNTLQYKPFLIKPNIHELEELFGKKLTTKNDVIKYAEKLRQLGARNVIVSMGKEGAILLAEDGGIFERCAPKGNAVNTVGSGDSMVAGFLAGWHNTGDYEKALVTGIAAGSATAFTAWLAEKEEIEKFLKSK
jgi:1-phosphofructokinase